MKLRAKAEKKKIFVKHHTYSFIALLERSVIISCLQRHNSVLAVAITEATQCLMRTLRTTQQGQISGSRSGSFSASTPSGTDTAIVPAFPALCAGASLLWNPPACSKCLHFNGSRVQVPACRRAAHQPLLMQIPIRSIHHTSSPPAARPPCVTTSKSRIDSGIGVGAYRPCDFFYEVVYQYHE